MHHYHSLQYLKGNIDTNVQTHYISFCSLIVVCVCAAVVVAEQSGSIGGCARTKQEQGYERGDIPFGWMH
jgi:Na+/H+ antiporter NhaC